MIGSRGRFELGGAYALARLFEVALDGGIREGTVFNCIAEGEAGEGVIVSCFDGCKPGGRDWITSKGVVETD